MIKQVNNDILKRGYIWQCAVTENKERYIANSDKKKQPCGRWHPYFGRQWASGKKDAKWQGICSNDHNGMGKRKRQLNLGVVHPEGLWFTSRKDTVQAAREMNSRYDDLTPLEIQLKSIEQETNLEKLKSLAHVLAKEHPIIFITVSKGAGKHYSNRVKLDKIARLELAIIKLKEELK